MDAEKMEREGWVLSTTTSGEQLRRILEMYRELAFEVRVEEVTPQECGGCTVCYAAGGEPLCRVYTKPKEQAEEAT